MENDYTIDRLDDQITWYGRNSARCQRFYKFLKGMVFGTSVAIPLITGIDGAPKWSIGLLGALITVIEGAQHIGQYYANWIAYRSTAEALKHEKYLYFGKAGPYKGAVDPHGLLAERVESLVSQEHTKWASAQEDKEKSIGEDKKAS